MSNKIVSNDLNGSIDPGLLIQAQQKLIRDYEIGKNGEIIISGKDVVFIIEDSERNKN